MNGNVNGNVADTELIRALAELLNAAKNTAAEAAVTEFVCVMTTPRVQTP